MGTVAAVVAGVLWLGFLTFLFVFVAVADRGNPPEVAPILALYREDGAVFAEVATCERDRAATFNVFAYGRGDAFWSVVRGPDAPETSEIRLFDTPAGWRLRGRGFLLDHPALVPELGYHVSAATDFQDVGAVGFRPSQLDGTSRDQVLTSTGRIGRDGEAGATVLSRDAFDQRVGRYCGKYHPS